MTKINLRDKIPSIREKLLASLPVVAALALTASTALTLLVAGSPARAAQPGQQLEFGVDMARRGLWAEALFRFERAAREDPNNPKILNNLAVAHEAVGDFDEALKLYREAVKLAPENAELKRNYARFVEFYQSFRPREEDELEKTVLESQTGSDLDNGDREEGV